MSIVKKSKRPHPRAVWNEERKRWKLGNVWYMPEKLYLANWCWYDWGNDCVTSECLDPNAIIMIHVDE